MLSIVKNNLSRIESNALWGLDNLTKLNISHNPLEIRSKDVFTPLIKLEILGARNILTGCETFNAVIFQQFFDITFALAFFQ